MNVLTATTAALRRLANRSRRNPRRCRDDTDRRPHLSGSWAAPVNIVIPACCTGWFFEHTADCAAPDVPRPCSDCYADPGTDHIYPHCCWYDAEPIDEPDAPSWPEAVLWPDAARWPGHPQVTSPPP